MSFDKATRIMLANQVGKARELLKSDVIAQLRRYGFQEDGTVLQLEQIAGLTGAEQMSAEQLRELLEHFYAGEHGSESARRAAYDRLAREIGFTTLNRLVALRMAEERGLIIESVGKGVQSAGFQLYERVANGALGDRPAMYRAFIESMYDEIAVDLPALFDRSDPHSQVFPSERCLIQVLELMNTPGIAHVWREDEAIGWVYQYYNDPDERKKMRESQAPRNSRELAVRNQFFTPRYVVEFLTDNTLGRIWYEMRRGETRLVDDCEYLVRRKHPIWLAEGEEPQGPFPEDPDFDAEVRNQSSRMWLRPNPAFTNFSRGLITYAQTVNGYAYALEALGEDVHEVHGRLFRAYEVTGTWRGSFEELRIALFGEQRKDYMSGGSMEDENPAIAALIRALCEQWGLEVEEISYRAKKDPRRLKAVDLAVGSGHFLLYSFDVLTTIYEEAWDDPELGQALERDYADRAAFLRDVPRLILELNLYGVDIDPRAAQIAQVALWLRAQRAWAEAGLGPVERPRVRRTGIVVAEPMPEGPELIAAAKARLDPRLHDLVDLIWDKMRLAGEAGSLLKIEDEIREAVRKAAQKVGVVEDGPARQGALLPEAMGPRQARLGLSSAAQADADFWLSKAEPALLEALRAGAEAGEERGAVRRRLFANNAAAGFAFIDLCRMQFDVALMNPPFGLPTAEVYEYLQKAYGDAYADLAATFMSLIERFCSRDGLLGAITTRAYMQSADLEAFRRSYFLPRVHLIVDLGLGVMDDAWVESSMQVLGPRSKSDHFLVVNRRMADEQARQTAIKLDGRLADCQERFYIPSREGFHGVPKSRITYGAGDGVGVVITSPTRIGGNVAVSRTGLRTFDDDRFYRLAWEVPTESVGRDSKWVVVVKNTEFSAYYHPYHVVVLWDRDARQLAERNRQVNGQTAQSRQGSTHYFKPGLSFSRRSEPTFTVKVHPEGCAFSSNGAVILSTSDTSSLYLCGLLNSALVRAGVRSLSNKYSYTSGHVEALGWKAPSEAQRQEVESLTLAAIRAKMRLERTQETDPYFAGIALPAEVSDLTEAAQLEAQRRLAISAQIHQSAQSIDQIVSKIYAVSLDEVELQTSFRVAARDLTRSSANGPYDAEHLARDIISIIIGCRLGRWQNQKVFQGANADEATDPFAVLPYPGSLAFRIETEAGHGSSNRDIFAIDELVSDDEIAQWFDQVTAGGWELTGEGFVAQAREALRVSAVVDYLRRPAGFFADHLARYSKSRRQAPIYWPLATASGRLIVWVYYPRLTADTLYRIDNQHVTPRIARVEREIEELRQGLERAIGRVATETRARLEDRQAFRTELLEFQAELLRVAALPYKPDHDDGVIITAAPLWKLFRLPKWRKATQDTWEVVERGDYDWAHLAYAIWPDRVREKCRSDKSLAIAHGLEGLYVEPLATAKKARGRRAPQASLINEDAE